MNSDGYVLITAARNEEAFIMRTLESVVKQTVLPTAWVIVDDGSADGTARLVEEYARKAPFIQLVHGERATRLPGFSAKVSALRRAAGLLSATPAAFIANLDADISFGEAYFETLIGEFAIDARLGVAGGFLCEAATGLDTNPLRTADHFVPGAVQCFRRCCFEQLGGYPLAPYGGEDTALCYQARMKGWRVRSFQRLVVMHHKPGSAKRGLLREFIRDGRLYYTLGSHPLVEVLKSLKCMGRRPLLVGGGMRSWGYLSSWLSRQKRIVDSETMEFIRKEQVLQIRAAVVGRFQRSRQYEHPHSGLT